MSQNEVKKGMRGDAVKSIQERLVKLGFDLTVDGIFGDGTDHAVRELQTLFGYTVDGIVGEGTAKLIDAQIGYAWSYKAPDAKARALQSQGKAPAAAPAKPVPGKGQEPQQPAPAKGAPPAKK